MKTITKSADRSDLSELQSWEVIRLAIESSDRSDSEIANDMSNYRVGMGVDPADLKLWQTQFRPGKTKSVNPLERLLRFTEITESRLPLRWLAARCGGFFLLERKHYEDSEKLADEWYSTWKRFHDLRGEIVDAWEDDHRFSAEEVRDISLHWLRVKGWVEGLILAWERVDPEPAEISWCPTRVTMTGVESCHVMERAKSKGRANPINRTIAEHLMISESSVKNWFHSPEHRQSGTATPLDQVLAFTMATESQIPIDWLFARQRGVYQAETFVHKKEDAISRWERAHMEMAELDAAISRAVLEKNVPKHIRRLRKEWEDVKAFTRNFLDGLAKVSSPRA